MCGVGIFTLNVKDNIDICCFQQIVFRAIHSLIASICLEPGKCLGKEKNSEENHFLMFGFTIKNIKEN